MAYKGRIMEELLQGIVDKYPELDIGLRGIGMVWGLDFSAQPGFAAAISREAFANHLVIEQAGAEGQVVKFLPALTIDEETLREGMAIIAQAMATLQTKGEERRRGVA